MDEDIKIVENFIQYNKFYKEENGKLTITIDLDAKTTLDKATENLLSRLKTAERMNDVLADEVEDLYKYLVEEYGCFSVDYSKDTENTSKQEILEWARKKVEDEL